MTIAPVRGRFTGVSGQVDVQHQDQGLAGALFTTSQQTGATVGLAILATAAAARTSHASGSLTAGYQLSFLIATGMAALAGLLAATLISSHDCQRELDRQRPPGTSAPLSPAEAQLRKC
jgi:hypothetical protein